MHRTLIPVALAACALVATATPALAHDRGVIRAADLGVKQVVTANEDWAACTDLELFDCTPQMASVHGAFITAAMRLERAKQDRVREGVCATRVYQAARRYFATGERMMGAGLTGNWTLQSRITPVFRAQTRVLGRVLYSACAARVRGAA